MRILLAVFAVWLTLSGVIFASLVLALGLPVPVSLAVAGGLGAALCWFFFARDIDAEPLTMRESTWNTPEDEDQLT